MNSSHFTAVHGHAKHGAKSLTYRAWEGMRKRCMNPRAKNYDRYGGRGIRVCARWDDFANFLADMGEQPAGKQIERRDNDGNYEPNNCCWATKKEQAQNRSTSRPVTYLGRTQTLMEWCEELDVPYNTAWCRLFRSNWPVERAFAISPQGKQS
jgi:hypothetical protein